MAVAVQPTAEASKSAQPMGLIAASCVGAVFVLGAAFFALNLLPAVWVSTIGAGLTKTINSLFSEALLMVIQLAVIIMVSIAGAQFLNKQKIHGVRGGVFFVISTIFAVFFCTRALYLLTGRGFSFGMILASLINVAILFFVVQFYRTGRFAEWSKLIEDGGLFSFAAYKSAQGQKVRRLTIIGLLLILGSGVWTLMKNNWLPVNTMIKAQLISTDAVEGAQEVSSRLGDWVVGGSVLTKPVAHHVGGFTILPDLYFTVPMLLILASLWFAWRVVNFPAFADFLIATEAEINKVSWTPRKALIRDTLVVLTSLILITVFLFLIDIFWGWLLSRELIGVLPTAAEKPAVKQTEASIDW